MANDRLMIECTKCKESRVLLKWNTGRENSYVFLADEIEEWLLKHLCDCQGRAGACHLGGNPGFRMITETTADTPSGT
jgi:hypothetical protein